MLSDLHFEPFADPAKLTQLRKAPIDQWIAILNAPDSATKDADYTALQKACPVRGVDTNWPLLAISLRQAAAQPRPLFVTVSGDLLAHNFDCRFAALATDAKPGELSAFASKTVDFLATQLHAAYPQSPVYLTLGNNDSGCADYREDRDSAFLRRTAAAFASAAVTQQSGDEIRREFPVEGAYNIAMPAPVRNARLIVLQDLFESEHYKTCGGAVDASGEAGQIAWLTRQLQAARAQHQHVWVMAHLPPGIDVYATIHGQRNVCQGKPAVTFLDSTKLALTLEAFPDVISLAIFAHSHEDELRLLHAPGSTRGVAAKLVASISPVNGNVPTFTVAQVDPATAVMRDYTVYTTGSGTQAQKEYSFREAYGLPAFSASALQSLTDGFLADRDGSTAKSHTYQHFFFPGDDGFHAAAVQLMWRTYSCSLTEDSQDGYRDCVCAGREAKAGE